MKSAGMKLDKEIKSIHQNINYFWDFCSQVYPFPKQASLTHS